jgi:outer membrane receptor protein involved in Fe transport
MMKSRMKGATALAGVSALALGLALSSQAFAQAATATTEPAAVGEVVVTASRVQRLGFEAPTPTTVQTSENIERQAFVMVTDFLNQVPAMRGSTGAGNLGLGGNVTSNPATSYLNLRNLGAGRSGEAPARTLVLVDGKRVVFSGTGGAVDMNMIPTMMIDRTDIVTGGASALYGSDAVAGVVNIIYKKRVQGIQAEASYGESKYGDNETWHGGVLAGTDLFGGKGNILFGVQYDKSKGVPPSPFNKRGWAAAQYGSITGAGNVRYYTQDIQASNQSYGGLITTAGPLKGIAFNPDGTPYQFVYGNQYGNAASTFMAGGSNYGNNNADTSPIIAPTERYNSILRGSYDFTDHFRGVVTLNYAFNQSNRDSVSFRDPSGNTSSIIRSGNPFIPASVQAIATANNIAQFTLGRVSKDMGPLQIRGNNQVYQAMGALEGDFDALSKNWSWDASASYGSSRLGSKVVNNRIDTRFAEALDAVRGPNGVIQCASAVARANGCLPYNPFGQIRQSDAVYNYFQQTSRVWQQTSRTDYTANLRGAPVKTWAGDVSIATGLEHRIDKIDQNADAGSLAGIYSYSNNKALAGSIKITEGYFEAVVPLASDMAFAKNIDFDGAIRYAHYQYSGGITSWKGGLSWVVTDEIRLRGSYSRDVRAPNVAELFTAGSQTLTQVQLILPGQTTQQTLLTNTITRGNLNLAPETAKTLSYGLGVSPHFIPGLRASIDYYRITISDAIETPAVQTIATQCQLNGDQEYCKSLVNNGASQANPFTIFLQPLNISQLKTSGLDMEVNYTTDLSRLHDSLPGRLSLLWLGNYTQHMSTTRNGLTIDNAGVNGQGVLQTGIGTPHWTWDANANYRIGRASFNFHVHYIGSGKLDNGPQQNLLTLNFAPSRTYYAIGATYDLPEVRGTNLTLFGNINNLTNLAPNPFGRAEADVIGRYMTVGVRMKM